MSTTEVSNESNSGLGIVVRSPNWIGDHVMALPFYRGLRKCYPNASLILLCPEEVAEIPIPGVFDEKILMNSKERKTIRGFLNLSEVLMERRINLAIALPASFSSALLFAMARISYRVGFAQGGSALFLTSSLSWKGRLSGKHKSEMYVDLLEFLMGMSLDRSDSAHVNSQEREKLIVVAPGASIALREWPYFQELLVGLRRHHPDYRVVVVGSSNQAKWHGFLKRLGDSDIEDYIEKTTIPVLIDLFRKSRLVIANDSGAAHLAATLGQAPTLVLFGPGDPAYVMPQGRRVELLRREDVPCSPCERAYCRAPKYQLCLISLTPAEVWARACEMLG